MSDGAARFAFLVDWARRDRDFGMRQARLDEAQFPGIAQDVQDFFDLDEESVRAKGNWSMVLAEKARFARPQPTPAPIYTPQPPAHQPRRKARA